MSIASSPSDRRFASSPDADASKARLRVWLRILKVSRIIERELRERLRVEFDTTLPRFDVMAALHRTDEGLNMSELSGVLRVSNGNVTGIVDRLVADGLIVRVPVVGDRRAMTRAADKEGPRAFLRTRRSSRRLGERDAAIGRHS
jgi:DNA-binding MarR family transcriptional regulator